MKKKRSAREKIRRFTPFIGIISILVITKLGITILDFEKYGWEARDTFVLLLFPAMLILGNIYCGWFCFGGMLQKVIYKMGTKIFGKERQKRFEVSSKVHNKLKYVRYVILIVWISTIILATLGHIDSSVSKYIKTTMIGLLSLVSLPIGLFTERFLCRYFCINGAIYGIFNKIGFKRIIRNTSSCVSCTKCDQVCPVAIEVSTKIEIKDLHCINCYKCVNDCPVENTVSIS